MSKIPDRYHLEVSSAGFLEAGATPPREAVEVIRRLGGDLNSHLSSNVKSALEPLPDLILTMTRQHVRSLVDLERSALRRTFTFKEFVRRAQVEGRRRPGESLSGYVSRVDAGRVPGSAYANFEDDIADPIGRRKSAYERCARELEGLTRDLIGLVCPPIGGRFRLVNLN